NFPRAPDGAARSCPLHAEVVLPLADAVAAPLQPEAAAEGAGLLPAAAPAHRLVAVLVAHEDREDDLLAPGVDQPVFGNARLMVEARELLQVLPLRTGAEDLQHPVGRALQLDHV